MLFTWFLTEICIDEIMLLWILPETTNDLTNPASKTIIHITGEDNVLKILSVTY
jgi:hypothetical protein